MCQLCVDAVRRHYPELGDGGIGELLMSATCFPYGSPKQIERQIIELRESTDGTLGGAIEYAEQQLDEQIKHVAKFDEEQRTVTLADRMTGE